MLIPLSAQRDIQSTNETQKRLAEIHDALLGFAVIHGRLPCPTTTANPASANYGLEDNPCIATEGYLPWKALGVQETDAWGTTRSATGDPFTGYWRYRVDSAFATPFTLVTPPGSALSIQDASGNALTQTPPNSPVAIVFSTGPNLAPNGENATVDATYQAGERSQSFDDLVIWLGRPILLNRLVAAGRLPF